MGKTMGSVSGMGSRCTLSRKIKFSFPTANYVYMIFHAETLHTFLHDLTYQ